MLTTSVVYCYRSLYKLYFFPVPRCSTRHAKIKHTLLIHIQFSHIVRTRTRRTFGLRWPEPYGSKFSFKVPAVAPTTSKSNADPLYPRQVAASKYTDSRTSSSYTDDITRPHYTRVAAFHLRQCRYYLVCRLFQLHLSHSCCFHLHLHRSR